MLDDLGKDIEQFRGIFRSIVESSKSWIKFGERY